MTEETLDRAETLQDERIRQDREDLNHEMSGADVGRIKRFVAPASIPGSTDEKSQEFRRFADMMLLAEQERLEQTRLLNDRYAALDKAYAKAITDSEKRLQELKEQREAWRQNGTKLSDGSYAYYNEDDERFYSEDRELLGEEEQLEAQARYQQNDSTVQQRDKIYDASQSERQRLRALKDGRENLHLSKDAFDNEDLSLDEFEEALDDAEGLVESYLPEADQVVTMTADSPKTASAASEFDPDGAIQSEAALLTAFNNAAVADQIPTEPSPQPDIRPSISPKEFGMAV